MKKISDSIYVETDFPGANVGCVLTDQGAVLIDTPMFPEEARQLQGELGSIQNGDIAYIVYSHQHFDHVIGAAFLTRNTIACRGTLSGIGYLVENLEKEFALVYPELHKERKGQFQGWDIVMPQILFSKDLTLQMGNKTLELSFVGGHSSASILVTVPEERVLFAGDNIVSGMLPVTANCRFGGWIDVLRHIEDMDIDTIIPGHGEPCGKEQAKRMRLYFEDMRDTMRPLVGSGATREDVIQKMDLSDSAPVPLTDEMMPQVHFDIGRMYNQMTKGQL